MTTDLPPWGSDCELDEETLGAVVREQFPEVACRSVRYLQQGWDSRVFLVDDVWILRMPKRADVVPSLVFERRLLPRIAARLPVAVPNFELEGRPSKHFPHPFSGYRMLPGVLADSIPRSDFATPALAKQLGRLLRSLHAMPLDLVHSIGVPVEDEDSPSGELREALEERSPQLERALGPDRWLALQDFVSAGPPPPADRTPRFTHADLDLGHLLIEPRRAAITGVIDWTDASIGDPAYDFVAFQVRCGEDFVSAALDAYGGLEASSMHAWIRDAARRLVVVWLGESLEMDEPAVPEFIRCFDRLYGTVGG